jgi:hypothetical protein
LFDFCGFTRGDQIIKNNKIVFPANERRRHERKKNDWELLDHDCLCDFFFFREFG